MQGKYKIKPIVSTDKLPYNQIDQRYLYYNDLNCALTQRTSVALHGDNIVWASCVGVLSLSDHDDHVLDTIKVHTSQIWWIQVVGDRIFSVAMENPTIGNFSHS